MRSLLILASAYAAISVTGQASYDTRGDDEYRALAAQLWDESRLQVEEEDPLVNSEEEEKLMAEAARAITPAPNMEDELLKRLSRNPMWAIERSSMRLVSMPVIEQGFWREVAINFERLRILYGRYVADIGNRRVPDRLIALKLRQIYIQSSTCTSFTYMSEWHRSMAKAMVNMMLMVYPIKTYYLGQEDFPLGAEGDVAKFSRGLETRTVIFHDTLYRKRAKTRLARERPIPFSLNNPIQYLHQHLDHLDTIRPYDKEAQLVCQLITPVTHKGLGTGIRTWRPTETNSYRYIMGAILQCLGEKSHDPYRY